MRLARAEPGKRGSAALTFTKHLRIMKQDGVSMKTLTLKNKFQTNATLLPNDFIDNYMVNANGEFIKVYLFLLRHAEDDNPALTLSMIADCLNNTEKDILRALRYWESEGLLRSEYAADGKITSLELQSCMCMDSSRVPEYRFSCRRHCAADCPLHDTKCVRPESSFSASVRYFFICRSDRSGSLYT